MPDQPVLPLLETLLNCPTALPSDWHLSYGLSLGRSSALINTQKKDRNSFFNRNSETALTAFFFCNLDRWHQVQAISPKPRNLDSYWSDNFFHNLRNPTEKVIQSSRSSPLWDDFIKEAFPNDASVPSMSEAVLLFELEVLNRVFNPDRERPGKAFRNLSFLDIEMQQEWSQYDAVLIVRHGNKGTIYFIEAKLSSDVSRGTTRFPYVSQIIRNLEAAFRLTRLPSSYFEGWDWRYIVVCPEKSLKYKSTYYSYALAEDCNAVAITIDNYACLLANESPAWNIMHDNAKLFEEFRECAPKKVAVVTWGQIASIVANHNANFWATYRSRLEYLNIDRSHLDGIVGRFRDAGVSQIDQNE